MRAARPASLVLLLLVLTSPGSQGSEFYQSDSVCYLRGVSKEAAPSTYEPHMEHYALTAGMEELLWAFNVPDVPVEGPGAKRTCERTVLSALPEPFHPSMLTRRRPVRPLPGAIPKALHRWPGTIPWARFTAVPSRQDSPHETLRYKVMDGALYVQGRRWPQARMAEEMLLVATYLYDLPDMDFMLSWCDGVYKEPVLQYSADLREPAFGFTYAYAPGMWLQALSLQQSLAWARCIDRKYPPQGRKPRAVWRGSPTDVHGPVAYENLLDKARVRLHVLGRMYPDVLDAKISSVIQVEAGADAGILQRILVGEEDTAMQFEGMQGYAAVLDVDGNGFSSRFHRFAQHSGPVAKQASHLPGYFEHLLAPGVSFLQFANNLTDVVPVARQAVAGALAPPNAAQRMADNMRAVAAITLNKWAMVDALAYSLASYAAKTEWEAVMQPGYSRVPFADCCEGGNLPAEFLDAIRAADAEARQAPPPAKPAGSPRRAPPRPMGDGRDACVGFEQRRRSQAGPAGRPAGAGETPPPGPALQEEGAGDARAPLQGQRQGTSSEGMASGVEGGAAAQQAAAGQRGGSAASAQGLLVLAASGACCLLGVLVALWISRRRRLAAGRRGLLALLGHAGRKDKHTSCI